MKYLIAASLVISLFTAQAQTITGTWQLTEEKTCFQSSLSDTMDTLSQSDTEKELSSMMGESAASTVARLIRFDGKGRGEEGIFSKGKKKGAAMEPFRYQIKGNELQLLDKKSGIATERYIIDELTSSSLRFHDAKKECEIKVFTKVK